MAKQDKSELIAKLQEFLYSHDLNLTKAGILLKMSPSGISRMLNRESKNIHPRTAYKIKKLLGELHGAPSHGEGNGQPSERL